MIEFRNPHYITPPGTLKQILSHPTAEGGAVELAVFNEHRYAFFYWSQWTREFKTNQRPCLVSFDWHQDLCYPSEIEKEWLSNLDLTNDADIAIYSWAKLCGNNDDHILAAAYLNLIGNIYIHCHQGTFDSDWEDEELIDIYGNTHIIKKFKSRLELEKHLLTTTENLVYFDIDLDFFTNNGDGDIFKYMSKKQIKDHLSVETPLINWIFERLAGFTIATEPEHCGGLLKSNEILDIINNLYFNPGLFSENCDWRHKNTVRL